MIKTPHYVRVEEFMRRAKQPVRRKPEMPPFYERKLRDKLILEEALETIRALGCSPMVETKEAMLRLKIDNVWLAPYDKDLSLVGIADGCADIKVVTTGTLVSCGIPDNELQELVDDNNLGKLDSGHSIRDDGKVVKPEGYKPPDIRTLLIRMGAKLEGDK